MATQGKTPAMGGLWVAVNFYIDRQSGTTAWVKECKMLRSSCLLIYDVDTTSPDSHLYLLEWMFQISDATPQLCMHAHTQAFDIDPRLLFGRAGRLRLSGELGNVSLIPTGSILLRAMPRQFQEDLASRLSWACQTRFHGAGVTLVIKAAAVSPTPPTPPSS